MLVDTHAHLNFPDYQQDLKQVIKRSCKNGAIKIICVSSNIDNSQKAIEIAKKFPGTVFAAIGIHPQQTDPETQESPEKQIKTLNQLAQEKEVVAIGECGLDYSPAPPGEKNRNKKEQYYLFEEQIKTAQRNKLPLMIHTRQAFSDTLEIIKNSQLSTINSRPRGIFHCYSAGKKGIGPVLKLGFYFGVDGNLTYDQGLQNIYAQIPLNRIVLETDSPYLSPAPFRNQRNEPKNIKLIAACLAKIKNQPTVEIERQTTINALKVIHFAGKTTV